MNEEKINNSPNKLRILVAPLDWGLGHATRCIPIIRTLLKHNTEVLLAAKGQVKTLLQNEFPDLIILPLDGYNITYSRHEKFFLLHLITQLPKVFFAINKETKWLKKITESERIDAVISDNRPGLSHPLIPCIYITHQLQIQTDNNFFDTWIRRLHYQFMNRFSQCWIPDNKSEGILAGALSHPISLPAVPCKYLGILSRFEIQESAIKYEYLLLISGPEPQRTIFENVLLQIFDSSPHSFAIARGMPEGSDALLLKNKGAKAYNHLGAEALNELILQSGIVIARSGYSTVMDLMKLQKKAVLIPTPGQTEQEYLADFLCRNKMFNTIAQKHVSYERIQDAVSSSAHQADGKDTTMNEGVITNWLKTLHQLPLAMKMPALFLSWLPTMLALLCACMR